ncbi:hypothetical protein EVAR_84427_1 [Eumeta japonica]|uniref:Uncharacterized protein n=1 Tax=Eumeta variegata TaxID=151549 RepID=A0A4C1W087_EUMVA|nr:hypothetical protein EVAR_84427_1 [Eumeta japonica]
MVFGKGSGLVAGGGASLCDAVISPLLRGGFSFGCDIVVGRMADVVVISIDSATCCLPSQDSIFFWFAAMLFSDIDSGPYRERLQFVLAFAGPTVVRVADVYVTLSAP